MESRARVFVFVGKLTTSEAADTFLKWRERVVSIALREGNAFIAKIRRDAVIMWLRKNDWRRDRS
jgi:phage portal protein BeeE